MVLHSRRATTQSGEARPTDVSGCRRRDPVPAGGAAAGKSLHFNRFTAKLDVPTRWGDCDRQALPARPIRGEEGAGKQNSGAVAPRTLTLQR